MAERKRVSFCIWSSIRQLRVRSSGKKSGLAPERRFMPGHWRVGEGMAVGTGNDRGLSGQPVPEFFKRLQGLPGVLPCQGRNGTDGRPGRIDMPNKNFILTGAGQMNDKTNNRSSRNANRGCGRSASIQDQAGSWAGAEYEGHAISFLPDSDSAVKPIQTAALPGRSGRTGRTRGRMNPDASGERGRRPGRQRGHMMLSCPNMGCEGRLPYVNAKTNLDKTVKIWRRVCPLCGVTVVDTGVFSREVYPPVAEVDGGGFGPCGVEESRSAECMKGPARANGSGPFAVNNRGWI